MDGTAVSGRRFGRGVATDDQAGLGSTSGGGWGQNDMDVYDAAWCVGRRIKALCQSNKLLILAGPLPEG